MSSRGALRDKTAIIANRYHLYFLLCFYYIIIYDILLSFVIILLIPQHTSTLRRHLHFFLITSIKKYGREYECRVLCFSYYFHFFQLSFKLYVCNIYASIYHRSLRWTIFEKWHTQFVRRLYCFPETRLCLHFIYDISLSLCLYFFLSRLDSIIFIIYGSCNRDLLQKEMKNPSGRIDQSLISE